MDALRSQAIDIIEGLPESYIAYTLDILKNVQRMSAISTASGKASRAPLHLHQRKDSAQIRENIDALSGALPCTDMTLADLREERLKKYANLA